MDLAAPALPPDTILQAARTMMVDSQVRPNKVNDRRVLDAMRRIPREYFLPPALAARAYSDEDVPLGHGRVLMEPMVIARLVQLAAVRPGDRALVVAAGSGYGAALLAACGAEVTALEDDPALLALAKSALARLGLPHVTLAAAPPAAGWPAGAPYDIILIEGGVEALPPAIPAQLRPAADQREASRLLMVHLAPGQVGQAVLGRNAGAALRLQPVFDAATPPLPALRRTAGFVF